MGHYYECSDSGYEKCRCYTRVLKKNVKKPEKLYKKEEVDALVAAEREKCAQEIIDWSIKHYGYMTYQAWQYAEIVRNRD